MVERVPGRPSCPLQRLGYKPPLSMTARQYIEKIIHYQRQKDYPTAYNTLQEALLYYPHNEFLQGSEVYLLFKLKRLNEARQKAEARFDLMKTNSFLLSTYIDILSIQRDMEQLRYMADWLKSTPIKDERVYTKMADTLIRQGQRGLAEGLLNAVLYCLPTNKEIEQYLQGLTNNGHVAGINYYRERFKDLRVGQAIAEIENILVLHEYNSDTSIRLYLAELYRKTGNLKAACEVYLQCLKIQDEPYVRKMLGFAYYRLGEIDKAFIYLRDAFIENPQDHALYTTIAKIIEHITDKKDAEAMLNEALIKHPKAGKIYGLLRRLKT